MKKKIVIRTEEGEFIDVSALRIGHGVYVHRTFHAKGWTLSVGDESCLAFFRYFQTQKEAVKVARLLSALFDFSKVSKLEEIPKEIQGHLLVIRDLLDYKYDIRRPR